MDANWFKGEFPNGAGNWRLPLSAVESDEFPHGVAAVSEMVHGSPNPLAMIMWVEPERVAAGSYIAATYPEYVFGCAELKGKPCPGGLLNLGNPNARRYITEFLCAMVKKFKLEVLRFDYNINPAVAWFVDSDKSDLNRRGVAEASYIEGLYSMWDEIRARNPGLVLDNCASGGRRLDMETMSRSVSLWRTDWTSCDVLSPDPCLDLSSLQAQTMGATQWLPVNSGGTGSDVSPYAWRSAGVASKSLVWGEAGWAKFRTPEAIAQLRLALAESERLAATVLSGADFWNLSPVDPDDSIWAAYQLHSPPTDCGFVIAFRRIKAAPSTASFPLVGVLATSEYSLSWSYNYSVAKNTTESGVTLLGGAGGAGGLHVELATAGSSVLVEYCSSKGSVFKTDDSQRGFRVYDSFDVCTPKLADEAAVARFAIEPASGFETLGWLCTVDGCNNSRWCKDVASCSSPALAAPKILSLFPSITGTGPPWCTGPTHCINGGVPQRANTTAQLSLIRDTIDIWLPDRNWDGVSSLDFEFWSPVFAENIGGNDGHSFHSHAYQEYSIQLVREANPGLNTSAATALAEVEFTRAAVGRGG